MDVDVFLRKVPDHDDYHYPVLKVSCAKCGYECETIWLGFPVNLKTAKEQLDKAVTVMSPNPTETCDELCIKNIIDPIE